MSMPFSFLYTKSGVITYFILMDIIKPAFTSAIKIVNAKRVARATLYSKFS